MHMCSIPYPFLFHFFSTHTHTRAHMFAIRRSRRVRWPRSPLEITFAQYIRSEGLLSTGVSMASNPPVRIVLPPSVQSGNTHTPFFSCNNNPLSLFPQTVQNGFKITLRSGDTLHHLSDEHNQHRKRLTHRDNNFTNLTTSLR